MILLAHLVLMWVLMLVRRIRGELGSSKSFALVVAFNGRVLAAWMPWTVLVESLLLGILASRINPQAHGYMCALSSILVGPRTYQGKDEGREDS